MIFGNKRYVNTYFSYVANLKCNPSDSQRVHVPQVGNLCYRLIYNIFYRTCFPTVLWNMTGQGYSIVVPHELMSVFEFCNYL